MQRQKTPSIVELLEAGKCVMIGEYRGSRPDTISYISKKDGKAATMGMINHIIEVGQGMETDSVKCTQMVPDGTDPKTVGVPFLKGQRVVVVVEVQSIERGTRKVRVNAMYDLEGLYELQGADGELLPSEEPEVIPGVRG